jgi:hypothetical protein
MYAEESLEKYFGRAAFIQKFAYCGSAVKIIFVPLPKSKIKNQ